MFLLRTFIVILIFSLSSTYAQIPEWSGQAISFPENIDYMGPPLSLNVVSENGDILGEGQLLTGGQFIISFNASNILAEMKAAPEVFPCQGSIDPNTYLLNASAVNVINPETGEDYGRLQAQTKLDNGFGITTIHYADNTTEIQAECNSENVSLRLNLQPGWNISEIAFTQEERMILRSLEPTTPIYWLFFPSSLWLERYLE